MSKTFSCPTCASLFKTTASLASHKHRYHSKTKQATKVDDISSLNSEISATSSLGNVSTVGLETKIRDNVSEIRSLDWAFNSIKNRVEALEATNHPQYTLKQTGGMLPEDPNIAKISVILKELRDLQFQSDLNKSKIELLKRRMQEMVERFGASGSETETSADIDENNSIHKEHYENEVSDSESMTTNDVIDAMVDIRDLFMRGNDVELQENPESLKGAINVILNGFSLEDIQPEDISLLQMMSNATTGDDIRNYLKDNFDRLVTIFTELEPVINSRLGDLDTAEGATDGAQGEYTQEDIDSTSDDENDY